MDKDTNYKTNSFYLAAFLLAKDLVLKGLEMNITNKAMFMFQNSDELQELIRIFNFGDSSDQALQVSFRKAEVSIKKLKALIYG